MLGCGDLHTLLPAVINQEKFPLRSFHLLDAGIEPKSLRMLSRCSPTEHHSLSMAMVMFAVFTLDHS